MVSPMGCPADIRNVSSTNVMSLWMANNAELLYEVGIFRHYIWPRKTCFNQVTRDPLNKGADAVNNITSTPLTLSCLLLYCRIDFVPITD